MYDTKRVCSSRKCTGNTTIAEHKCMLLEQQLNVVTHVCTYGCMCACMYEYRTKNVCPQLNDTIHKCMYVCVCVLECMYVGMYVCMYSRIILCMYSRRCVCMHSSMYLYVCIHICMYACMYACMHACTQMSHTLPDIRKENKHTKLSHDTYIHECCLASTFQTRHSLCQLLNQAAVSGWTNKISVNVSVSVNSHRIRSLLCRLTMCPICTRRIHTDPHKKKRERERERV